MRIAHQMTSHEMCGCSAVHVYISYFNILFLSFFDFRLSFYILYREISPSITHFSQRNASQLKPLQIMSELNVDFIGKVAREKLLYEATHFKSKNLRRLVAHANLYDKYLLEVQNEPHPPPTYTEFVSFPSTPVQPPHYTDFAAKHTETLPEYNSSAQVGQVSLVQEKMGETVIMRHEDVEVGDVEVGDDEYCEDEDLQPDGSDSYVSVETVEIFGDD